MIYHNMTDVTPHNKKTWQVVLSLVFPLFLLLLLVLFFVLLLTDHSCHAPSCGGSHYRARSWARSRARARAREHPHVKILNLDRGRCRKCTRTRTNCTGCQRTNLAITFRNREKRNECSTLDPFRTIPWWLIGLRFPWLVHLHSLWSPFPSLGLIPSCKPRLTDIPSLLSTPVFFLLSSPPV